MNKKKILLLLTLPALASCGGFSVNYIVEGNKYNSPVFTENYYEHWDNELKNAKSVGSYDVTDNKIMSFGDIGLVDKNLLVDNPYSSLYQYASDYNLMKADQSFYYGVQSKLFDGEVTCDGYYQKRRVQSNEKGFSVRFQKESDELSYFAMQFKTTTNNQYDCYPVDQYVPSYASDIGVVGDIYIDVSDWSYFVKNASGVKGWEIAGSDFSPKHMNGLDVNNSKELILYGEGAPSGGHLNNVYVDTTTLDYYEHNGTSWVLNGRLELEGTRRGAKVWTGYLAPAKHDKALYHNSSFKINISIYTKNGSSIVKNAFLSEIVMNNNSTNNGDEYRFFAFDLSEYNLSRMVGFSVTFSELNDALAVYNQGKKIDGVDIPPIDYALFIYEVFLPYTYWH